MSLRVDLTLPSWDSFPSHIVNSLVISPFSSSVLLLSAAGQLWLADNLCSANHKSLLLHPLSSSSSSFFLLSLLQSHVSAALQPFVHSLHGVCVWNSSYQHFLKVLICSTSCQWAYHQLETAANLKMTDILQKEKSEVQLFTVRLIFLHFFFWPDSSGGAAGPQRQKALQTCWLWWKLHTEASCFVFITDVVMSEWRLRDKQLLQRSKLPQPQHLLLFLHLTIINHSLRLFTSLHTAWRACWKGQERWNSSASQQQLHPQKAQKHHCDRQTAWRPEPVSPVPVSRRVCSDKNQHIQQDTGASADILAVYVATEQHVFNQTPEHLRSCLWWQTGCI